jgi:prepilin-type N-terminal cleavage/methylation domain-containing protein
MNMIEKRKAMRGQSGFTLIELLVVIAILAVLGGAAIIGIGALRDNAETVVCDNDAATVETAAEAADVQGVVPATPGTYLTTELITEGLIKDNDIETRISGATQDANDVYVATKIGDCTP